MEDVREERQELAGHLLAELDQAKDDFRHRRITEEEFVARARAIRRRARSGNNGYLRSMEEVQRTFTGLMAQAETMKQTATA